MGYWEDPHNPESAQYSHINLGWFASYRDNWLFSDQVFPPQIHETVTHSCISYLRKC